MHHPNNISRVLSRVSRLAWIVAWGLFTSAPQVLADDTSLKPSEQLRVIAQVVEALQQTYIFPEVSQTIADRMASAAERYDRPLPLDSFAQRLTGELQAISRDGHLVVRRSPPDLGGARPDPAAMAEKRRIEHRLDNFGFARIERLVGNVGYLDLRFFADAADEQAAATAKGAMAVLASTDALILDLRQNHGGNPSMTRLLASYFFDKPVHLTDIYSREADQTQSLWTHETVDGERLLRQPIYVLTSQRTFSAAEGFTYHLKHLGRVRVVGERTGGGAHPVKHVEFKTHGLRLFLPFARAINPITGTNWEGRGVQPHVPVEADQAFDTAHLAVLRELLPRATNAVERFRVEWALAGIEAAQNPTRLSASDMSRYVGRYGPCRVRLEEGELFFVRGSWANHRMVPAGEGRFLLDGFEPIRLEFLVQPRRLRLHYIDGRQEIYPASE